MSDFLQLPNWPSNTAAIQQALPHNITMAPLQQGVTAAGMEWSIHACPSRFRQEVGSVLHGQGLDLDQLLIVPTCQHAAVDLVKVGDVIEAEKDLLLERFMNWAKPLCESLIAQGHWADYIDPCSGLPMIHQQGQVVYPEVEALSVLMGFQTSNAGCCKVLLHPKWGVLCTQQPCSPLHLKPRSLQPFRQQTLPSDTALPQTA